jgi:hypothetical protein
MNQSKIQVISQNQLLNGITNASKLTLIDDPLIHLKKQKELLTNATALLASASQLKISIQTAITNAMVAKNLASELKLKALSFVQAASLCNNNPCHGSLCVVDYVINNFICICNSGFTGIIQTCHKE